MCWAFIKIEIPLQDIPRSDKIRIIAEDHLVSHEWDKVSVSWPEQFLWDLATGSILEHKLQLEFHGLASSSW
jgi:hypothetical protein